DFGSDRAIVGRIIRINGTPFTVIGVAPSAFTGMNPVVRADFFVPLMMSPQGLGGNRAASLEARDSRNLTLKGRLKSGVSRQLVTESLMLAIAGGALGLGIGYAGIRLFRSIEIPTDLPIMLTFRMGQRALAFSLVVAVASAVIFGVVPALQATRTNLTAVMK